jgi:hypothetical protein
LRAISRNRSYSAGSSEGERVFSLDMEDSYQQANHGPIECLADEISQSPQEVDQQVSHGDSLAAELDALGCLPTVEFPVLCLSLGKSGAGLFLHLDQLLDLQTLRRLAASSHLRGLLKGSVVGVSLQPMRSPKLKFALLLIG